MINFIAKFGTITIILITLLGVKCFAGLDEKLEKYQEPKLFNGIGEEFCTSYPYNDYIDEFKEKYGMREFTLNDLNKLKR